MASDSKGHAVHSDDFEIEVIRMGGSNTTCRVPASMTVAALKADIESAGGPPVAQQRLLLGAEEMMDGQTLIQYGPFEGGKAELMLISMRAFIQSVVFEGSRAGYCFRLGDQGLGYYLEVEESHGHGRPEHMRTLQVNVSLLDKMGCISEASFPAHTSDTVAAFKDQVSDHREVPRHLLQMLCEKDAGPEEMMDSRDLAYYMQAHGHELNVTALIQARQEWEVSELGSRWVPSAEDE